MLYKHKLSVTKDAPKFGFRLNVYGGEIRAGAQTGFGFPGHENMRGSKSSSLVILSWWTLSRLHFLVKIPIVMFVLRSDKCLGLHRMQPATKSEQTEGGPGQRLIFAMPWA